MGHFDERMSHFLKATCGPRPTTPCTTPPMVPCGTPPCDTPSSAYGHGSPPSVELKQEDKFTATILQFLDVSSNQQQDACISNGCTKSAETPKAKNKSENNSETGKGQSTKKKGRAKNGICSRNGLNGISQKGETNGFKTCVEMKDTNIVDEIWTMDDKWEQLAHRGQIGVHSDKTNGVVQSNGLVHSNNGLKCLNGVNDEQGSFVVHGGAEMKNDENNETNQCMKEDDAYLENDLETVKCEIFDQSVFILTHDIDHFDRFSEHLNLLLDICNQEGKLDGQANHVFAEHFAVLLQTLENEAKEKEQTMKQLANALRAQQRALEVRNFILY